MAGYESAENRELFVNLESNITGFIQNTVEANDLMEDVQARIEQFLRRAEGWLASRNQTIKIVTQAISNTERGEKFFDELKIPSLVAGLVCPPVPVAKKCVEFGFKTIQKDAVIEAVEADREYSTSLYYIISKIVTKGERLVTLKEDIETTTTRIDKIIGELKRRNLKDRPIELINVVLKRFVQGKFDATSIKEAAGCLSETVWKNRSEIITLIQVTNVVCQFVGANILGEALVGGVNGLSAIVCVWEIMEAAFCKGTKPELSAKFKSILGDLEIEKKSVLSMKNKWEKQLNGK